MLSAITLSRTMIFIYELIILHRHSVVVEIMGAEVSKSADVSSPGDSYSRKLFFYPDAEQGDRHSLSSQELETRLRELIDVEEVITLVALFKTPLAQSVDTPIHDLCDYLAVHAFLFFRTQNWCWSIEKNGQGVIMQRSKDLASVLLQCAAQSRNSPVTNVRWPHDNRPVKAGSRCSVAGLLELLNREEHLEKEFDPIVDNCKFFATNVFNSINCDGLFYSFIPQVSQFTFFKINEIKNDVD